MVHGKGINDMPRGWRLENKLNEKIYRCWQRMLRRCYDDKTLIKHPTYKDCYVCDSWLSLSNFVDDIKKLENYDKWAEHINDKINIYELDKDIKSNGINKCYCFEQCKFALREENTKQAMKTRDNTYLYSDNNYMKRINKKGLNSNGFGLLVAMIKDNDIKDIKYNFQYEKDGFIGSAISKCCNEKRKSHKGFNFKYLKNVSENDIKTYIIKNKQIRTEEKQYDNYNR